MTQLQPGEEIRANTQLPASRQDVEFLTQDGHRLVGELALPSQAEPLATLLTLHPLPTHGGFMDSHVYRKAALRLPYLAGLGVLRFNTRGTSSERGKSEGSFAEGVGERYDVQAAAEFLDQKGLKNIWAVGWSFGTELTLKYASYPEIAPGIAGAVLLSPPLHRADDDDLRAWGESGLPIKILIPEFDDYLRGEEARKRFALIPQAEIIEVPGAKHLWVGEKYAHRCLEEISRSALNNPGFSLPTRVPASGQQ